MRRLGVLILMLVLAGLARAQQYTTGFENPPYSATPAGVPLAGQDGWFNPIAGSAPYTVHPYTGNGFGFQPNPSGQIQFTGGANGGGTALARAQHSVNFASNDVWTASWDMAVKFLPISPPASNPIGSFSLQDSVTQRSFSLLATWSNINSPTAWNAGFLIYDAGGVPVPQPGAFAGLAWQGLLANHWYRLTATLCFRRIRILEGWHTALNTLAVTTGQPAGWYLLGGPSPGQPLPTGVRFATAGNIAGNAIGWDNLDVCPFQVSGFTPPQGPEGTIVQISGCGFGNNPANLSVSVQQGTTDGVPMTVLTATDTLITARLGPVSNTATTGRIMVVRGTGAQKPLVPTLDDVIPEEPLGTEVWDRQHDPRSALSLTQFLPLFSTPPVGTTWFIGQNVAGQMNLAITVPPGGIQPNTTIRVISKLHDTTQGIGSDLEATTIRLRVGGDVQYLADRIVDVVQSAYSAHSINTTITVTNTGANSRLLTLILRDNLSNPIPVNFGEFDVCTIDPIRINPFAIGPVTAFYHAGLTNQSGAALVSPVNMTGNDGATISPNTPVTGGLRVDTDLIPLPINNSSFTARAWGVLGGVPNQLIGTARLQRLGSVFDIQSDFTPIGASQVRIDVYYNTALKATAIVAAGSVGQVGAGVSGLPQVTGCGGRPTNGPASPFLWIDLDRECIITPSGGSPVPGNQIRVTAGTGAGNVQNFQAFDLAAGFDTPLDVNSFVIFSAVEGGICYANCDGSTTPPMINVLDFSCFLNKFASGDMAANCDGSTTVPQLNVLDFACFVNTYAAGCS